MSNRVYTYVKITELKKASFFSQIAALPQLTMSLEMARSMAFDMRIFQRNIMGFSGFLQRLFPGWNTSGQRFAYITVLNHFLRDKIRSAKDKSERDWLFGCKKNLYFAINNVIRLEEARVRPEDIQDLSRDIRLFVEMWKKLENADDSIHNFRNRLVELQDADIKINPLGEIFETGEKTSASNISIIKYNNTVEFIEDIPRIKEAGYYIYCTDDRAANNMLKDYYPEQYETRNLLSYPIGQFVYALHRMWDEDLQGIVLSQNGLRKCFASGWLSSNGKSSVNFTEDLERLLPYFEGCYTVDEWKARLDTFTDACHNAVDVFTVQADDPEDKRKQETLGNPLRYFSAFSINESHIAEVMDIIDQLIRMAKALFGGNEPVSIHEHMNKLDGMLYMHKGMPKELYLEEREKVKQIFEALESEKVRDFLCYPGDLAAALLSFMGGRTDDEEQSHAGLQTLVFNIFQVEAAPIAAKEKVHICLADISRLPGAAGKYGWPLDEDVLLTIAECNKNTYLNNWIKNNRLTPLSNRYYLYTALKNKDVEISWIQKQGEKLYSPSPYITLLDKLSDTQIRGTDARLQELPYVAGIYPHKHLECSFDIRDNEKMYEHDVKLVYSLCPMRFVYEYVLGDSSAYRSEYQQNRAIVRLIQIFNKLLKGKYTIEQIAGQVFEIFPNIRKAEKRQMRDDAARWPVMEPDDAYTAYKDKNYTNYRLNLTFLDERIYEQARKNAAMLMSQEGRRGIFYDRGQQTGSRNCEFCPHSVYCMSALYGIDYKGEQG